VSRKVAFDSNVLCFCRLHVTLKAQRQRRRFGWAQTTTMVLNRINQSILNANVQFLIKSK
jgi:hypothetical protein